MNAGIFGMVAAAPLVVVGQHPVLIAAGFICASVLFFKIAALVGIPERMRKGMLLRRGDGQCHSTFTWNKHALSWTNEHDVRGSRPWTEYVWMAENEDVVLLFVTLDGYQMIPKSWFRDQQQLDEFRKLAATCLIGARDPALQSRDHLAESLPAIAIMGGAVLFTALLYLALS